MGDGGNRPLGRIVWAAAGRPLPGEEETGDHCLVQEAPHGILVAVADGLGHGPEAALAGRLAIETLSAHADEPICRLAERCHRALKGTRGVALSLAVLDTEKPTLAWAGVGNVEAVLLRADPYAIPAREYLLQRSGVMGYHVAGPLREEVLPVFRGDTLILATDGIRSGFVESVAVDEPPEQTAEAILARDAREIDDALVLVVRYLGGT